MKKKGLAVLLCLCMVVSLLPVTALAAGQWTYYPKSDEEHRLSGYIKQGDLQVGVMSEKEADTGDKSLYNLVIDGNGDNIPAGVTEVDLTGTIQDESGKSYVITELGSAIVKDQITSITLPDTVKRIKYNACLNAALTSINFPSNLESIGYGAFSGSALTAADCRRRRSPPWKALHSTNAIPLPPSNCPVRSQPLKTLLSADAAALRSSLFPRVSPRLSGWLFLAPA